MKVKELIEKLEAIEDKEREVYSYDNELEKGYEVFLVTDNTEAYWDKKQQKTMEGRVVMLF